MTRKTYEQLRSARWFAPDDFRSFGHRSRAMQMGYDHGDWQGKPGHDHVELTDKATGRHLSLRFQDDVMVGCNAVGWTEHIGVMRGLVEGQVKLGAWKDKLMQDPTRLVQAYQASALKQDDAPGGKTGRRR